MVTAATALIGGKMQADASKDAAQMQAESSQRALDLQEKMYNQQRADYQPWRDAGMGALTSLQDKDFQRDFTAADFQKDPGYDFRMAEGQKALERSAAARGGLQGGGTLKALSRYGQDYASNEYNNAYNRFNNDRTTRFNRLSSIAGFGQTATGGMANASSNYGSRGSDLITGEGNALAAGRLGEGQAWGNAMSNLSKAYTNNQQFAMKAAAMGGA